MNTMWMFLFFFAQTAHGCVVITQAYRHDQPKKSVPRAFNVRYPIATTHTGLPKTIDPLRDQPVVGVVDMDAPVVFSTNTEQSFFLYLEAENAYQTFLVCVHSYGHLKPQKKSTSTPSGTLLHYNNVPEKIDVTYYPIREPQNTYWVTIEITDGDPIIRLANDPKSIILPISYKTVSTIEGSSTEE